VNREKSARAELLELVIYCGVMWAATHPAQVEDLHDRGLDAYRRVLDGVMDRLVVWDTLAQIRSLPER
jgi:hypothetical protein